MRPAVARSPDSLCRRSARTATARKLSNELDDDVGDVSSLAGSFVKVAAAHRIQLGIRTWAMIFECGGLRSVVGLAHDLSPCKQRGPSVAVAAKLAQCCRRQCGTGSRMRLCAPAALPRAGRAETIVLMGISARLKGARGPSEFSSNAPAQGGAGRCVTQMTHVDKIAVGSARVLIFSPPRPVCCSLPRGDRGQTVRGDSEIPEGAPLNSWPVRWCANSAGEFRARALSE